MHPSRLHEVAVNTKAMANIKSSGRSVNFVFILFFSCLQGQSNDRGITLIKGLG